MTKDKQEIKMRLRKLAWLCLGLSASTFIITYLFFPYVTCDGITLVKQLVAGKPFVTNMLGILGTDLLFASIIIGLISKIVVGK